MSNQTPVIDLEERFAGLLLGTAVGDALGLPAENLSADRIRRRWKGRWKMRFIFGKGMVSDDTEHTLMVAQALLSQSGDAREFQRLLARKFRWWFAGLPGGVGLATAKACLRLWIGFPANRSAVVSAGSGPAMRSAIIGAYFADAPDRRREFVLASSRLTHRGWQAETAALAIAECAALAMTGNGQPKPAEVVWILEQLSPEIEWQKIPTAIKTSLAAQLSVSEFAQSMGLERTVSGYSLHVVPVALYGWLRHPDDFRAALISVLECGGDTDTAGAILGALGGGSGGERCIPAEWLNDLWEWPRSRPIMEQVATRLVEQQALTQPLGPVHYFWPAIILRNSLFLATVLLHGFRRLAPPY
jgi:ADP-ribosyl-[dinitrogen reductase] hydrolase